MITIQKVTSNVQSVPHQSPDIYWHAKLCSWRPCSVWRSWHSAYLMYSFKYNQQDATLYSILYCCQCSTCFRRFLCPSSGAQNCRHSIWYMSSLFAATASASSKQAWHVPHAVCTVLSSWWWAQKPPETCRALATTKNIV